MNIVVLVGNFGRDPTINKVGEHRVCRFSLGVSQHNKETVWVYCECWDQLADLVVQHCKKGRKVTVAGELAQNRFEKDGQKKEITFVKCRMVQWDPQGMKAAAPPADDAGGW